MIQISFPDGSVRSYEKGTTAYQIAESISPRLARECLAASVNGITRDLSLPINEDAQVQLLKWDEPEAKHAFWHTSSHLLAAALQDLYPGIQFGIGPAIENGFYYDVDPGDGVVIKESDLSDIEAKMTALLANKSAMLRREISKKEALEYFEQRGEHYKVELIQDLEDGIISTYTLGNFTDLCRGPHLTDTSPIKAVKLTAVAGAYWRGDEKRKQLTRIYGISFPKKSMLDEYLILVEEAKKRDHRKLGRELELFMLSQPVGQGLPIWLPRGTELRSRLEDFSETNSKKNSVSAGYYPTYRAKATLCNFGSL
jgi:threonyl-tRNA synthetase